MNESLIYLFFYMNQELDFLSYLTFWYNYCLKYFGDFLHLHVLLWRRWKGTRDAAILLSPADLLPGQTGIHAIGPLDALLMCKGGVEMDECYMKPATPTLSVSLLFCPHSPLLIQSWGSLWGGENLNITFRKCQYSCNILLIWMKYT